MKLAALGGTVAALSNTQDAVAQSNVGPFVLQSRAHNPLRWPLRESELKPTATDIDGDGDFDIVVGEDFGPIRIYLNEGTPENPRFTQFEARDETMTVISQPGGAPAFADLNGDGNLDMVFGIQEQNTGDRIQFWTGNGGIPGDSATPLLFTEQTGPWDSGNKTGNPFDGFELGYVGYYITPAFVNIDGDADLDLLVGSNYKGTGTFSINYYLNDGQSNFTHVDQADSPFPFLTFTYNSRTAPQVADIDGDGEFDLVTGREYGDLRFFRGDGVGGF